jgi:hypothetical protein
MKKMFALLIVCASSFAVTGCDTGPEADKVAKQHKGCNCASNCNCASQDSQSGCGCVANK